MQIFQYRDYEHYVQAQVAANRLKLNNVWVTDTSIRAVCERHGKADSVLCHGTRNAAEQKLFAKAYPDAEILGSEISDTARQFPMTVQWDMHEPRPDWVARFDIVYSNSIDHAMEPERAVNTWLGQLSEGGRLYIDHANDPRNNVSTETDPLEIGDEEMVDLIASCGGRVVATLDGRGSNMQTKIYVCRG